MVDLALKRLDCSLALLVCRAVVAYRVTRLALHLTVLRTAYGGAFEMGS